MIEDKLYRLDWETNVTQYRQ